MFGRRLDLQEQAKHVHVHAVYMAHLYCFCIAIIHNNNNSCSLRLGVFNLVSVYVPFYSPMETEHDALCCQNALLYDNFRTLDINDVLGFIHYRILFQNVQNLIFWGLLGRI